MKVSSYALLAVLVSALSRSVDAAPCLPSDGFTIGSATCSYTDLVDAIQEKLDNEAATCGHDADTELLELLEVEAVEEVMEIVAEACSARHINYRLITGKGEVFDKAYYDGNTYYNTEREEEVGLDPAADPSTLGDQTVTINRLKNDPGPRIRDIYDNIAEVEGLTFPDHLVNFESCDLNTVMCCFTVDRQAGDGNGDCATPYADNCANANPGDNTDLCYVDMTRSPTSAKKNVGFAVYEGSTTRDPEEPAHCHAFAWSNDPSDHTARFKGNNLFYVSMYDHLTQRGYAQNVPGAPMCGCLEQMPVVTRSDCTQVDLIDEDVQFEFAADRTLRADVTNLDIDFNACQAETNNDLESYYYKLAQQGDVDKEQVVEFKEHIVGKTYCREAIDKFLDSQGLAQKPACPAGGDPTLCGCAEVQQADYRGTIAETRSGYACQRWDEQEPHKHGNTRQRRPDANLIENYCRNPDGEPQAWCYTTNPDKRWEICDVPTCGVAPTPRPTVAPTPEHREDCGTAAIQQIDYRGTIAETASGLPCQRWDSQEPHSHNKNENRYPGSGLEENYCRNPDGEPGAWCYTTLNTTRWELCDVPACEDVDATARKLRGA